MDIDIPILFGFSVKQEKYGFKPLSDWYKGKTRFQILKIATPIWANKKSIKSIYKTAQMLSIETGDRYEVDHVIPIKSGIVCGLHVETNLEVVKRSKNRGLKTEYQKIESNKR